MAELIAQCGVPLSRAENDRVQGHMMIKDALAVRGDGLPGLVFFDGCREVFHDLAVIQADENNPSDCAKEPHGVTHIVDALRYYCVSRRMAAERAAVEDERDRVGYDEFMTGGDGGEGYLRW